MAQPFSKYPDGWHALNEARNEQSEGRYHIWPNHAHRRGLWDVPPGRHGIGENR